MNSANHIEFRNYVIERINDLFDDMGLPHDIAIEALVRILANEFAMDGVMDTPELDGILLDIADLVYDRTCVESSVLVYPDDYEPVFDEEDSDDEFNDGSDSRDRDFSYDEGPRGCTDDDLYDDEYPDGTSAGKKVGQTVKDAEIRFNRNSGSAETEDESIEASRLPGASKPECHGICTGCEKYGCRERGGVFDITDRELDCDFDDLEEK